MRMFNPPHPGQVLRDYLGKVSVTEAAKHLRITRAGLSRILNGSAGISAEMALRLSDALGTTPELWSGMQAEYDLWLASKKRRKKLPRLTAAYREFRQSAFLQPETQLGRPFTKRTLP